MKPRGLSARDRLGGGVVRAAARSRRCASRTRRAISRLYWRAEVEDDDGLGGLQSKARRRLRCVKFARVLLTRRGWVCGGLVYR